MDLRTSNGEAIVGAAAETAGADSETTMTGVDVVDSSGDSLMRLFNEVWPSTKNHRIVHALLVFSGNSLLYWMDFRS